MDYKEPVAAGGSYRAYLIAWTNFFGWANRNTSQAPAQLY